MHEDDRRPFERQPDGTSTAIKIGIAIFIAITASWAVREAYLYWVVKQIGNAFVESTVQMQINNQENMQRIREQQQVLTARLEQQRAIAENQKAQAELEKAKLIQQQIDDQEAARQEARLKAQAWDKFFKPRTECDNPKSNKAFVECGNEFIRARKRFEAEWTATQN